MSLLTGDIIDEVRKYLKDGFEVSVIIPYETVRPSYLATIEVSGYEVKVYGAESEIIREPQIIRKQSGVTEGVVFGND